MTVKPLLVTLSLATLSGLMASATTASAQYYREDPRASRAWICDRSGACGYGRAESPDRDPVVIERPSFGSHAIRGWEPSNRTVVPPRGSASRQFDDYREGYRDGYRDAYRDRPRDRSR